MNRLPDWRKRLFDLTAQKQNLPFSYGKNDCTLFGADVVTALTGVDLAEKYRGKYRSLTGGIKLLKRDGYKSHTDFLEKHFDEVPTAFAQVGDLGIADTEFGTAICVVMGGFAYGLSEFGLSKIPTNELVKTFKV